MAALLKAAIVIIALWAFFYFCPKDWLKRIIATVELVGLALFVALQWILILALALGGLYGIVRLSEWIFRRL